MRKSLDVLLHLREHERKASGVALERANVERDRQQGRVDVLVAEVTHAREELPGADADTLACYHAFRLQREVQARREEARLAQRTRDADSRRARHAVAVTDELALERLMERRRVAVVREENRIESAAMDEIAARQGGSHEHQA